MSDSPWKFPSHLETGDWTGSLCPNTLQTANNSHGVPCLELSLNLAFNSLFILPFYLKTSGRRKVLSYLVLTHSETCEPAVGQTLPYPVPQIIYIQTI